MRKYIIYGVNARARYAIKMLGRDNIAFLCETIPHIDDVDGIKVISFKKLQEIHYMYRVVIAFSSARLCVEIAIQLDRAQIPFSLFEAEAEKIMHQDAAVYNALNKRPTFAYDINTEYFTYLERYDTAGFLGSYFWQDLWAARHIFEKKPGVHIDIGSRVDGFIAHLVSFGQKVQLFDIRPLKSDIPNVEFVQCDATNMENVADNSIESLSALCSLEHFGLGRYGDTIDPEACFKCFAAIEKKLMPGGDLYISVPIGKEHLEYNAHRVFFATTIRDSFCGLQLVEFSSCYNHEIEYNLDIHKYDEWTVYGGERFGLFHFCK